MLDANKNYVSVESQTERSITTGKSETRIFVKMYVGAVRDGLMADMGVRNWATLCVIASFMDAEGNCWPTQEQIAKGLGVSRQTASKYVNDLLEYRWKGDALVTAESARYNGQFSVLKYTLSTDFLFPAEFNPYAIISFNTPHNGSLSEEEKILYRRIPGYSAWVKDVKRLANYTCIKCGSKSNLVAHHINNYRDFPEGRTDIKNGACLCEQCHYYFHGMFGFFGTTENDFNIFMGGRYYESSIN